MSKHLRATLRAAITSALAIVATSPVTHLDIMEFRFWLLVIASALLSGIETWLRDCPDPKP